MQIKNTKITLFSRFTERSKQHGLSFSIHTGYYWSYEESFGFASLSTVKDHKAEAVHAAMADIFKYCTDKKKKRINIVSDSTVAQYHKKTNVFLLQSNV